MTPDVAFPHVTIRTMTDYLIAPNAHQRFTIIQQMKNQIGRRHFAPYYQVSRRAIRSYHAGNVNAIQNEIQRLARSRADLDGSELARANNNLRVLTDYLENFGSKALTYTGRQFEPLIVNGIRISTEPTLSGTLVTGRRTFECNVVVDTQEDAPVEPEIDYALELIYRGSSLSHPTPLRGAQYWHASSGDSWELTRSSTRRWRDIQDAAHEIALRWPTVRPR